MKKFIKLIVIKKKFFYVSRLSNDYNKNIAERGGKWKPTSDGS